MSLKQEAVLALFADSSDDAKIELIEALAANLSADKMLSMKFLDRKMRERLCAKLDEDFQDYTCNYRTAEELKLDCEYLKFCVMHDYCTLNFVVMCDIDNMMRPFIDLAIPRYWTRCVIDRSSDPITYGVYPKDHLALENAVEFNFERDIMRPTMAGKPFPKILFLNKYAWWE